MQAQAAAEKLRARIRAPSGVTVWPWHEDSGAIVLHVVLPVSVWMDISLIPKNFEGFQVVIDRRRTPVIR
jgi:hypothetical protein